MVGVLSSIPITVSGSALFGTSGSAGASILGAFNADSTSALFGDINSTTSSLMSQIKNNASQRLAEQTALINQQAADRNAAINVQNERWITVKAQVNNAEIAVSNGQDGIKKVADLLLLMRGSIAAAGTPGENAQLGRDAFDAQVTAINNEADSSGKAFNLVGAINRADYSRNQIEYRKDVNLNSTTLTGTYIGHDFRIEANDGTIWVPELGSDLIQAFPTVGGEPQKYVTNDNQTVNKATSTRNGLQLISYDPDTKQITVNVSIVPTDPPIVVTGTLKSSGIGVMQSWFYNDFATTADRARAFKDISAAEVNLTLAGAELQTAATLTAMDQRHVDAALNDLSAQTSKANAEQSKQNEDVQVKAAQQYLAMQANLQNLSMQQSNYLNAFSGFITDPFSQSLLDINA
jgi:hypothetical protein